MVDLTEQQLALKVVTQPNDANRRGDIFGGWIMQQIDIAGAVVAVARAQNAVATVAVQDMQFTTPLFVYDLVSFYAKIVNLGTTSITVNVEAHVQRFPDPTRSIKVAQATVVYVAINKPGEKCELPKL